MTNLNEIARRYAAIWNEPDADARRAAIGELWAEDGVQSTPQSEYRGHQALEQRVTSAYEKFVADQGFTFVLVGEPDGHHGTVKFGTHMVPAGGGDIAWKGSVFLILNDDGRITHDYQFVEN